MNLRHGVFWIFSSMGLALAGAETSIASGFTPPPVTQLDPKIESRVDSLLGQLTEAEKISLVSGADVMHTHGIPRLGIPALKFSDASAGVRCWGRSTAYPATVLLAATWDADAAGEMGYSLGRDGRARGVGVLLGPGVNIYREAQNGRNFEYLGEDPFLASILAASYIRGLQSQGVAGCVKHFAVNEQETQRDSVNEIVGRRALEEIYFPPFRAAIEQGGVWSAMAAYNKVNGDWCTANRYLLTDVLRDEWHFHGLLMSDWGAVHDTRLDLNAGTDLEMDEAPMRFYNEKTIPPLLASGAVTQTTLDEHVRRFLRFVVAMGFMDRDQTDHSIPLDDPTSAATALKVAGEGIVLLKNDGPLLPLARTAIYHLVVTGPNGDEAVIGGGGSSRVDPFTRVSVLQGLQSVAGAGVQVEYVPDHARWRESPKSGPAPVPNGTSATGYSADELSRLASADAVVFAGGLNPDLEHEGSDRPWAMPAAQVAELKQILAVNRHVIVVINAGGNLGLGDNLDHIPALLWAWYPFQNGNVALAKIIFGDLDPSGRLPDTFEKRFEDSPAYGAFPGDRAHGGSVRLDEGIYVGYRWYDKKQIAPAFPFGFGLSYTSFTFANAKVEASGDGPDRFDVSVEVKNTGSRAGAEVVQLYVRPPASGLDRPVQELKAFTRVDLQPGESKRVSLPLDSGSFATYDEAKSSWQVPAGNYTIAIGSSSRDLPVTTPVTVTQL